MDLSGILESDDQRRLLAIASKFDIPELEVLLAADALLIAKQEDREVAEALD